MNKQSYIYRRNSNSYSRLRQCLGDVIPNTLEIRYDRLAALMPLPRLRFEREIKEQLRSVIKPLKAGGYVNLFAVKPDWRGLNNADRLVFRFAD